MLSIRPVSTVDRALNLVFAPSRAVAELTSPLGWLRADSYDLANAALQDKQEQDEAVGLEVMQELEEDAMPFRLSLREGRVLVPGRVSERKKDNKDSLLLSIESAKALSEIKIGYPVVHGDTYVGRVGEVEAGRGRVRVDLVTGADFFVGATVRGSDGQLQGRDGQRLDLIVGGLDSVSGGPEYFAVHNPSVREFRPGIVEVSEPDLFAESTTHLADGYLLGRLTQLLGEGGPWSVEPMRNFESGLFHLVVILPGDVQREAFEKSPSPLRDGNWRLARLLSHGDPEVGRSGTVISLGESQGVRPGAAVIAGARLLGRVDPTRAGSPWMSRITLLGEPGLTINVVARIDEGDHRGEARVLGKLVSLGARENGIAFRWRAAVRLDGKSTALIGSDEAEALRSVEPGMVGTLFTGTGMNGVPGGLYIGRAVLPLSAGTHEIFVTDSTHGAMPSRIFARSAAQSKGAAQ